MKQSKDAVTTVKRYGPIVWQENPDMDEFETGDYVRYEDYAALEAEYMAHVCDWLRSALLRSGSIGCEALNGARYVGDRYPLCDPQGHRIKMYAVEVSHLNGPWEAIYCKTEAQARAIEAAVKLLEKSH